MYCLLKLRRAAKQVEKQITKEAKVIEKDIFHLQVNRFNSSDAAISGAKLLESGSSIISRNVN